MSFRLTPEQRAIVGTVRKLAQGDFRDRSMSYQDGTFPWDNMKALAEIGVLGMSVPAEFGGSELSILDSALVLEEIAKVCYVTAMATLGEVGSQTHIIRHFAPQAIKARLLPRVARGEAILAICMTEPDAGTDLPAMKTEAVRGNGTVRVNGVKTLISRADVAEAFVVFARVDGQPGGEGIGCVIVERGMPGLTINSAYHTMGGELLSEVVFDDCCVPPENLILERDGVKQLLTIFNTQRCLNASISLGLAEGALEESIRYMRVRQASGRRIGDFQGMRWKIADMLREIEAARGVLWKACLSAAPYPDPLLAAIAKLTCNEMSVRVTSEAIQIHGGYGFCDEFPVSRLYRAARYGSLGGGTSETMRNFIGKRLIDGFEESDGIMSLGTF